MDETTAPIVAESAPESSSAPVTPSDRLARMSPVESAAWRKDGTVPGTEAPAVSSQADGDGGDGGEDHSAAPDPPAAPVTVDPAASAAGKALNRQKQTAQQRINDLARDKYRLEGELKTLREQLTPRPAAAVEAPRPSAPPPIDPDAPVVDDFETYDAFTRAVTRYEIRLAQAESDRTRAAEQGQRQYADVATAHDARVRTFAEAHPDYLDVVTNQRDVFPTPLLADAVLHSELAPELAYYLNSHVDEYRALVALAPGPMLKALGRLESRLEGPPAAGSSDAAPVANHVTRAPAPPPTLGSRPAEPADEVERAGARRDVGAYLRAMNARDVAARR